MVPTSYIEGVEGKGEHKHTSTVPRPIQSRLSCSRTGGDAILTYRHQPHTYIVDLDIQLQASIDMGNAITRLTQHKSRHVHQEVVVQLPLPEEVGETGKHIHRAMEVSPCQAHSLTRVSSRPSPTTQTVPRSSLGRRHRGNGEGHDI
jgi:hypothetical protein